MSTPDVSTPGAGNPVRVLVVDDDALVRFGLVMMLRGADVVEVVGEAADGAAALDLVTSTTPDVVLMDVRMPVMDGLAATEAVRALPAPPEVLVLTTFDADALVLRALRAGASGFLLKDTPPSEIIAAVQQVAAGRPVLSPDVTRALIARATRGEDDRREIARGRLAVLGDRERAVAVEIGQGRSNAEIGRRLELSVPAVKTIVSGILGRLGQNNRVQIALLVHDAGLVPRD